MSGARYFAAAQNMPPVQAPAIAFHYAVKTASSPALAGAVRRAIASIDREVAAVFDARRMSDSRRTVAHHIFGRPLMSKSPRRKNAQRSPFPPRCVQVAVQIA